MSLPDDNNYNEIAERNKSTPASAAVSNDGNNYPQRIRLYSTVYNNTTIIHPYAYAYARIRQRDNQDHNSPSRSIQHAYALEKMVLVS